MVAQRHLGLHLGGLSYYVGTLLTSKCPLGAIGSLGRTHFSKYKDGSRESGVDGDRPIQQSAPLPPMGVVWGGLWQSVGVILGASWEHAETCCWASWALLRISWKNSIWGEGSPPHPKAVPCPRPQIPPLPRARALTAFRDQPPTCPRIFFLPRVKAIATSSRSCLSGASNHIPSHRR